MLGEQPTDHAGFKAVMSKIVKARKERKEHVAMCTGRPAAFAIDIEEVDQVPADLEKQWVSVFGGLHHAASATGCMATCVFPHLHVLGRWTTEEVDASSKAGGLGQASMV